MSAALSRMLPCAVASSRRSVSSSCFRSVLLSLMSLTGAPALLLQIWALVLHRDVQELLLQPLLRDGVVDDHGLAWLLGS